MSLKMGNSFLWVFTVSFLKILGKGQYGKEEIAWVCESAGLSSGSVTSSSGMG